MYWGIYALPVALFGSDVERRKRATTYLPHNSSRPRYLA